MKHVKLSLTALSVFVSCAAFAQTADEVISKHIEAIGGAKAWDKVKTIKLLGSTSAQGTEIEMNKTFINGKASRMDISAMGMKGYMIFTTTKGWSYLPFMGQTDPIEIPGDAMKSVVDEYDFKSAQVASKALIASATIDGNDTIDNKPCIKVKVTDKLGNTKECYFDATTYYLLKTEQSVKIQDQQQEMAYTYSNHKKQADGIVVPMTISQMQGDWNIKTVEVNKTVDDKIFAPEKKK